MVDVSIIIPTRNRPHLLRRALVSVVAQSGNPSFECIVIDDGDPLQAQRVKSVLQEFYCIGLSTGGGRGGSYARNLGIDQAKGDLVAFLDDDDTWEPTKLLRQVSLMRDRSFGLSYTAITVVSPNGHERCSFRTPRYSDQYRSIMSGNFIGTTSTVMVRRDALLGVGRFDETLPALQDYDLYIRLLSRYRTGWINEPLTRYHDEISHDKVSASRERFIAARNILSIKYSNDPAVPRLRKSLRFIELLKCIRSRRFLMETVRFWLGWRP